MVCTSLNVDLEEEPSRHKFVPSSDDFVDIIRLHYDVLSKYNVVWPDISSKSPNTIERVSTFTRVLLEVKFHENILYLLQCWAVEAKGSSSETSQKIKGRLEHMKMDKERRKKPLKGKEIIADHLGSKLSIERENDRREAQ